MATSTIGGPCMVCGRPSDMRCGGCNKVGYDFIYFCSREHQKFVWPVHRRICSREFHWPHFTLNEAEEVKKSVPPGDPRRTMIRGLFEKTLGKDSSLDVFVDSLTVRPAPDDTEVEYFIRDVAISQLRAGAFEFRASELERTGRGGPANFDYITGNPFGALASWQSALWPDLSTATYPWVPKLQHLGLVAFFLLGLIDGIDPVTKLSHAEIAAAALGRLKAFCEEEAVKVDNEKGRNLAHAAEKLMRAVEMYAVKYNMLGRVKQHVRQGN